MTGLGSVPACLARPALSAMAAWAARSVGLWVRARVSNVSKLSGTPVSGAPMPESDGTAGCWALGLDDDADGICISGMDCCCANTQGAAMRSAARRSFIGCLLASAFQASSGCHSHDY